MCFVCYYPITKEGMKTISSVPEVYGVLNKQEKEE
jgi:hypothetical protein